MNSTYHSKGIGEYYRSPKNLVIPPEENINTKQEQLTGERFPDNILILCDKCYWSCTCFNLKGLIQRCPLCDTTKALSRIPLALDETCIIEYDDRRGITLTFSRKQALR